MTPPDHTGNSESSTAQDGESTDALAQLIGAWLREQPLRRAPASLQVQVMAAIEQRRRQHGFQHWPLAARVAVIVLSGAMAKLAADISMLLLKSMTPVSLPRLPFAALFEALLAVSHHLPHLWLYGGIALSILVYGGLFGISTAVYRTLYIQR